MFIFDRVFLLPEPPYTPADKDTMTRTLYEPLWQQSMGGRSEQRPDQCWGLKRSGCDGVSKFGSKFTELQSRT